MASPLPSVIALGQRNSNVTRYSDGKTDVQWIPERDYPDIRPLASVQSRNLMARRADSNGSALGAKASAHTKPHRGEIP